MIYVADPGYSLDRACRVAERLYKLPHVEWLTISKASTALHCTILAMNQLLRGLTVFGVVVDGLETRVHSTAVLQLMQRDTLQKLVAIENALVQHVFWEQMSTIEDEAFLVSSGAPLQQLPLSLVVH